jgi:hypothetical protein
VFLYILKSKHSVTVIPDFPMKQVVLCFISFLFAPGPSANHAVQALRSRSTAQPLVRLVSDSPRRLRAADFKTLLKPLRSANQFESLTVDKLPYGVCLFLKIPRFNVLRFVSSD